MIDDDSRTNEGSIPEQPYETGWASDQGPVTALVIGGACTVSTADLDALALTLTSAADLLDQARLEVLEAVVDVEHAEPPAVDEEESAGSSDSPIAALAADPILAPPGGQLPGGPRAETLSPEEYEALGIQRDRAVEDITMILHQQHAIEALESLADGPGSLAVVAGALHDLADCVAQASEAYSGAESAVLDLWRQGSLPALSTDPQTYEVSQTASIFAFITLEAARLLTVDGASLSDSDADMMQVANLLKDEALAPWAIQDFMTVATALKWFQEAGSGNESAAMETYLAETAARLDPVVTERLPDTVQVGSRMVPTSSLTPMQRVAAYLALRGGASAADRHGERTGVTVTAHGGGSVTVPPGTADPFGLGTAVPVLTGTGAAGTAVGTKVKPPASTADVIRYSDSLKKKDTDISSGVVSVLRTDHTDGTTSWLVVVPGTTDWGLGDSNPQDLLTNFEAVAGQPTDMESAVVTAMREAGVQEGDPVALYGHSQGGATAVNIAADPAVRERFNVTHVLTAGSPVAGAAVPDEVATLHLENVADVVPALDGAPTPTSPTHTTVLIDTTETSIAGYPHGSEHYAQAVEHMGAEPAVDDFTTGLTGITGAGEEGAVTTEYVFDVTRQTPVTGWEMAAQMGPAGAAEHGSSMGYPVGMAGTVFPLVPQPDPRG